MYNKILISVIIPVYNSEKYVDRAIKSVLCQMDGAVELILVDDGSTDSSGIICDSYAAKYDNVRVIHKPNGGTSSAKNLGIKSSIGSYITFLDSDDYLEPNAYKEIQEVISKYEPDCIDFGWRYISNGERMPDGFHKLPKNVLLGERELYELILPPLLNLKNDPDHFIFDYCCNKVFNAQIIRYHNILFDEDKRVWEDRTFLLRCIKHSKTYYAINQCFYNYVSVPSSLSRRYNMDFFNIILANYRHYKELYYYDFDFDTQYANDYWCRAIENMIFRSLDENENINQIHHNILITLADELVINWYAKRQVKNKFELKISYLVTSGQYQKALRKYIQRRKQLATSQFIKRALSAIKRCLIRINIKQGH